jgi:hypothetical protein
MKSTVPHVPILLLSYLNDLISRNLQFHRFRLNLVKIGWLISMPVPSSDWQHSREVDPELISHDFANNEMGEQDRSKADKVPSIVITKDILAQPREA